MTTELQSIAYKAKTHPEHRFSNLSQLLDEDLFYQSWGKLKKDAAPGVDGLTAKDFKQNLSLNVSTLVDELRTGRYRAESVKRIHIPKANGKTRPLGLPTVKDKLCQHGVATVLNHIWEQDFLPYSYGYRPQKSAHGAVVSLCANVQYGRFGYAVEADIKGFFDTVNHDMLKEMLAQRIDDKRLLRLIGQWLKSKTVEGGQVSESTGKGTPQGSSISPVLANIYLHNVLDLWFEHMVKPKLKGKAMLIRYADDFVVTFQYRNDAVRFYKALPKRLSKYGLEVAPEKTRLMRLSRFHPGKERSFIFLGFNFYWDIDRNGNARFRRKTAKAKQKFTMKNFTEWIKKYRHTKLKYLLPKLKRKIVGFSNYFGLVDNSVSLAQVYDHVLHSLFKWLNRRSGKRSCNWCQLKQKLAAYAIIAPKVRKSKIKIDWYC